MKLEYVASAYSITEWEEAGSGGIAMFLADARSRNWIKESIIEAEVARSKVNRCMYIHLVQGDSLLWCVKELA